MLLEEQSINLLSLLAITLGLLFGSFLNVCIYRIPIGKTLGGRSACPHCNKLVKWYQNIPVFSFILMRGRCGSCKATISKQYPLVEILTAILSYLTIRHVNFDLIPYFLWFLLFICPLIVITFIDIKLQIIPDVISLPGIGVGIATLLYLNWPFWQASLVYSFLGLVVGGGSLLAIALIYSFVRNKEGMGGGDIKLCAMLGTFLGWKGMLFVFFVSSILALAFAVASFPFQKKSEESQPIPYGPYLSAAAIIYFFYGDVIITTYLRSIGRLH